MSPSTQENPATGPRKSPSPSDRTPVMFRVDGGGVVTAVFIDLPWNHRGDISCYAHVGQHSSCTWDWVARHTSPATPEQYASLKRELEAAPYGYQLEIVQQRTPAHRKTFARNLMASLGGKQVVS